MKTKTAKRRPSAAPRRPASGRRRRRASPPGRVPAARVKPPAGRLRPAKLWQLRLYVMDETPKGETALENLKKICEQHLKGRYRITVIDLLKHPQLAKGDQILATPTVVRRLPTPVRIVIGNLSNLECVLVGLDLRATH